MLLHLIIALLISFGYVDCADTFNELPANEQNNLIQIIEDDLETI